MPRAERPCFPNSLLPRAEVAGIPAKGKDTKMTWGSSLVLVVKDLLSNAGDVGSTLGQGAKTPRAMGQLSLCAAST